MAKRAGGRFLRRWNKKTPSQAHLLYCEPWWLCWRVNKGVLWKCYKWIKKTALQVFAGLCIFTSRISSYNFLLRMTDTMTSQNIDISSRHTLCIWSEMPNRKSVKLYYCRQSYATGWRDQTRWRWMHPRVQLLAMTVI
jgi:hypothetical protein